GPGGRPGARLHQSGAGPVVQLAVGDPGRPAGGRPSVPGVGVQVGQGVTEQRPLRRLRGRGGGARLRDEAADATSFLLRRLSSVYSWCLPGPYLPPVLLNRTPLTLEGSRGPVNDMRPNCSRRVAPASLTLNLSMR